ncbi:DUF1758 domain-containing protein [Trichonephila inaurata madagascariensis]|uniref:DUF1758 domain-containing protein n=1 Tax=Trichonephila inaurata madagascariensis TaxID=2747483 RepID=A0A8X7CTR3_9ARAC|nr:DUF1758 domain-containing protein [Trichonephila inaurata madagascariensis]
MILFKLDQIPENLVLRTFSADAIPRLDELLQFLTLARDPLLVQLLRNVQESLLHIENVSSRGKRGAVNVLNSCKLSVNAPVFSPVPVSGTSEQSENSRVVDVTSCISDVNPDVQILLCTALIQAHPDTHINGLAEIHEFTSHFHINCFSCVRLCDQQNCGMIPSDLDSSMRELFGDISLADPAFYKSGQLMCYLVLKRLLLPLLRSNVIFWVRISHLPFVQEINNVKVYAFTHHGVVWNCTTKLRVVFDASSKTSSGLSLNDLLMVGPRVQPELFPILIQFRIFSVAICADVEKMFRQIKVHEKDVDWQRILWRDSPTEPIKEYRLTTVTYGTSSAPFLSTRTLRQLAIDEQENYPAASRATLSHFYVDDLLSGSATKKGAIQPQCLQSCGEMMKKKGGFSLRKWVSNDPDVLATISEELKAVDSKHTIKRLANLSRSGE